MTDNQQKLFNNLLISLINHSGHLRFVIRNWAVRLLHFSVHVQRSVAGNNGPSGFDLGRQGLPVHHTQKILSEPGPTRQHRQQSLSFLLNRQNPALTPATRVTQGRRVTAATSQTSQLCRRLMKA